MTSCKSNFPCQFTIYLFVAACMIASSATAFAPVTTDIAMTARSSSCEEKKRMNTNLSCATTEEIKRLSERSQAVPYLLRPQKCKGYVGDVGFDPLEFSSNWSMEYLREAELKHGRVCMLAWTGWVAVDLGFRVAPAPEGWADLTSLTAHDALVTIDPSNPQGFWSSTMANILYAIAIPELYALKSVNEMMTKGKSDDRDAGDLGMDWLGFLKGKSKEEADEMKLKELKHARLGMLAFSGVVAQSTAGGFESFPYVL
jgi:hypothetical protein